MHRSTFLTGTSALLGAAALPRMAFAQAAPLRFATLPVDIGATAYYAQDKGFFKAAGLTNTSVATLKFGSEIVSAVAGGSIEVGQANILSFAVAHERGLPFSLIAPAGMYLSTKPTSSLLVLKDSPLKTAHDFIGKTVAVNGLKAITQISVMDWADKNGGDSEQIKFLELPFREMEAALTANRVDAVLMAEPDATIALAAGHAKILTSTFDAIGKSWLIGGWFAKNDWIDANPALVKTIAKVMRDTAVWSNAHQAETAVLLENNTKVHVGSANRVVYAERLDPAQIQPNIDAAAKYKLLKAPFPASELISKVVSA